MNEARRIKFCMEKDQNHNKFCMTFSLYVNNYKHNYDDDKT